MSSGHPTSGPRHLAGGAPRRSARPNPRPTPKAPRGGAGARHLARTGVAPARARQAAEAEAPDGTEVAPLARVKRSRIAFALSATVAALPVLVVDNLPATAAQDDEVRTVAAEDTSSSTTEAPSSTTTEDPTTTTVVVEVADTVAETTTSEAAEETTTTEAEEPASEPAATMAQPAPEPAPAPTTTTQTPPSTPPSEGYAYGDPEDPATWDRLAQCESHGNWSLNSGNGYYGGLQFSLATWQDVGGSGYPHENTREEQIHRGQILQARYGWGQWPHCSSKLGYR